MTNEEEIKKIEDIARSIGVDDSQEKNIFELLPHDKDKILSIKQGKWENEPWFILDEKDSVKIAMPSNSASMFIESYKRLVQENFDLRLERSILRQFPIDFSDVFVVCMDEISKMAQKEKNINLDFDAIVKNVKEKYPNLFLDIELEMKDANGRERYE